MGHPHHGHVILPNAGRNLISLFLRHRPGVSEVFGDERLLHA
jgi:hypothetical protein